MAAMTEAQFEKIDARVWREDTENEIGHEVEYRRAFYAIAGGYGFTAEEIQLGLQQEESEWGPRRALKIRAERANTSVEQIINADKLAAERDPYPLGRPRVPSKR